jgi:hypothetical protein
MSKDDELSLDDIEAKLDVMLDPITIKANVKKAEEKYSRFTKAEWMAMRRRAKTDLFYLNAAILGYNKLAVNLHGDLCHWFQKHHDDQFREVLLPRGHYKSTVITKGASIQTVLPDDVGDQVWPRNLGTDCRLSICHETHESASRFLFEITGHFTGNPTLMGLFPECIPNPKKNRINKHELELPRFHNWSEPTIDTMGVGAKGQGRHYNFLMLDDLIGDKARDSPTEMATAKDWFDNIQSFFSSFAKDKFVLIGTRWAFDDLYAHAHKIYEDELVRYIRSVEEKNPKTGELEAIFPEEFPLKKLKIIRKNRKVFSAQYANDPAEGGTEFDENWLRYFYWTGKNTLATFNKDKDGNPKGKIVTNIWDMDRLILIDPAMTGAGGYCVTGTDYRNDNYVLKALRLELKTEEFVPFLFSEVTRWQPRAVVIEEVLFSGLYKPFLEAEMKLRGTRFYIELARTKQQAKETRVRGLSNYLITGQIIVNESQTELIEEVKTFGANNDYHILDALAYGPERWRRGRPRAEVEEEMRQSDDRDEQTGYSQI